MSDTDNSTKDEDKKSMSKTEVIEKLQEEVLLFKDQEGIGHLAVGKHGANVFPTQSKECTKFIRHWLVKHENRYDVNRGLIEDVQAILDCIAEVDGETIPLNVRVAKENTDNGVPGRLWYDLRDGQFAVEVDENGWQLVPTPVKFRCYNHLHSQVKPMKHDGRSLDALRPLIPNLSDDDWLVFQVFLVAAYISNYPKPTCLVDGSQGAGKTSFLRLVSNLIDPSSLSSGIGMIRNADELRRVASQSYVPFFDNVSRLSGECSDTLATLSTGGTTIRRTLFTTEDSSIHGDIYRTTLINGIPKVANRPDLIDRAVCFSLKRIKASDRLSQAELDRYLEEHKPEILGTIFNILSDTLKKLNTLEIPKASRVLLSRLVDFSEVGYWVASSIKGYSGNDFLKAYKKMRERSNDFILESNPVAQAIQYLLTSSAEWTGSPFELWSLTIKDGHEITPEEIDIRQEIKSNPYFPKNAASLIKELARCQAVLSAVGIDVECTKDGKSIWQNGRRTVILRKRQQD